MVYAGEILAEGTDRPTMSTPAGTAFPSTFLTGDIFFRTDLNTIYVRKSASWEPIGGSGAVDTGGVIATSTTTIPFGFFECNGAAISRTTYATLFATISTTFGNGNGSTTFNLPDLRGEFIRGFDNARGVDSGRGFGTFQADAFKSHTHSYVGTSAPATGLDSGFGATTTGKTTGAAGGSETRPRNIAMTYIIKY